MAWDELTDPLLAGANPRSGVVAVEWVEGRGSAEDRMAVFSRDGDSVRMVFEPFRPFLLLSDPALLSDGAGLEWVELKGGGALRWKAVFSQWKVCVKAKTRLAQKTGVPAGTPNAPYLFLSDPVHQHLLSTGQTLFKGMGFDRLRRLQIDIECRTTPGYEFCNASREGDVILAIGLGLTDGTVQTLALGRDGEEPELLKKLVDFIRDYDPDVIEGHNLFNFDLPYIAARAERHGIPLTLGRGDRLVQMKPSRFSVGERMVAYTRFDLFGRHVIDTYFLAQLYDLSHRELESYGLKAVARHFGVAAPDRTYLEGGEIAAEFERDPEKVLKYLADDIRETRALSDLLSPAYYIQSQFLPFSYQTIAVRGNATKIDALLVREYLRQGNALPLPDAVRAFAGGYTDLFRQGLVRNVHHVDVRSLYPSLMLTRHLAPRRDELGVFLKLLDTLRTFRLDARRRMSTAAGTERGHLDALQSTYKILINSFYGYLGFSQAHFSDFDAAERVTSDGRALMTDMLATLRRLGATPVESDTDGIYYVPPENSKPPDLARFQEVFRQSLPPGIEVEFDGEYPAMYSHRMKNYALATAEGGMILKGAALKSRGLEPFQRDFMRDFLRCRLEGRDERIPALKAEYAEAIRLRRKPIRWLAKTETLQDNPATYAAKLGKGARSRNAAYELVLHSSRVYRAGDQVSYYVTGTRADVPVHSHARLTADWNPEARDENVAYYLAKLDALYDKFNAAGEDAAEDHLELPGLGRASEPSE
jgi:DNA polymerase elongation subunit (family B)